MSFRGSKPVYDLRTLKAIVRKHVHAMNIFSKNENVQSKRQFHYDTSVVVLIVLCFVVVSMCYLYILRKFSYT